jgi:hypothetical protein
MARRVFFSFHYERDAWRAAQVRNSGLLADQESVGFLDAAEWEQVKRRGEGAVERWIDRQLDGTSVTVVLIGAQTSERPYVGYEIKASHVRGNGMLGIYINSVRDQANNVDIKGENPFDKWQLQQQGRPILLSAIYPTYDWVADQGRVNMSDWIETAAGRAGK